MSIIQTAATGWIDGFARLGGGPAGRGYPAVGYSVASESQSWGTTDSDSYTSVISDVEEEGEVEETHEHQRSDQSYMEAIQERLAADEIEEADLQASPELIASVAAEIGLIEAAMRKHQSSGTASFKGDEQDDESSADDLQKSLRSNLLKNPVLLFSATKLPQNRSGLLSLLAC